MNNISFHLDNDGVNQSFESIQVQGLIQIPLSRGRTMLPSRLININCIRLGRTD
jgi:hypothetical protein